MTEPNTPTAESALDPTAPAFAMPSDNLSSSSAVVDEPGTSQNGQAKSAKQKRPEAKTSTTAEDVSEAGAGVKLTGAQLKKQKAAEKAARRAEKIAERGAEAQNQGPPSGQQPGPIQTRENQDRQRRLSTANREGGASAVGEGSNHRRSGSTTVRLPLRGAQPSSTQQQQTQGQSGDRSTTPREKVLDKRVPMLSHLYPSSTTRRATLTTADRQIHPAVLTLALQLRDYVICGSNARTVATLLVFKKVIQSYDTPSGVALSRDLTRHLSHQINFLSQARPLNVAQGNSIRWIKKLISALDPDLADTEAKTFLCKAIDSFVREKITLADEMIVTQAVSRIEDHDEVILTYGKSSVVEKTLVAAWSAGRRFKVIIVDSRPLFEGRNMARSLLRAGLTDVQYSLLSGLADAISQSGVTKCLLGAAAMLGNGNLRARAGTAMVAMMAKETGGVQGRGKIPVIVLCESVKFTARIALDSVSMNEVADPDSLIDLDGDDTLVDVRAPSKAQSKPESSQQQNQQKKGGKGVRGGTGGGGGDGGGGNEDDTEEKEKLGLAGWKNLPNLYLVNLMYDVTPAEYLDMVISEMGTLPPSAVPVVNGVHGGDE